MDRGAWQATVHGVARVEHDLATKPPLGRLPGWCPQQPPLYLWAPAGWRECVGPSVLPAWGSLLSPELVTQGFCVRWEQ